MRDKAFALPINRKFIARPFAGVVCLLMETDMIHEGGESHGLDSPALGG